MRQLSRRLFAGVWPGQWGPAADAAAPVLQVTTVGAHARAAASVVMRAGRAAAVEGETAGETLDRVRDICGATRGRHAPAFGAALDEAAADRAVRRALEALPYERRKECRYEFAYACLHVVAGAVVDDPEFVVSYGGASLARLDAAGAAAVHACVAGVLQRTLDREPAPAARGGAVADYGARFGIERCGSLLGSLESAYWADFWSSFAAVPKLAAPCPECAAMRERLTREGQERAALEDRHAELRQAADRARTINRQFIRAVERQQRELDEARALAESRRLEAEETRLTLGEVTGALAQAARDLGDLRRRLREAERRQDHRQRDLLGIVGRRVAETYHPDKITGDPIAKAVRQEVFKEMQVILAELREEFGPTGSR